MKKLERYIFDGLRSGDIEIIQSPNDCSIACKIGEYWFYFIGSEYEDLTPNEVLETFTKEELTALIYAAIVELDKNEQNYYKYWLAENLEENKTLFKQATELLKSQPYLRTGEHRDFKAICVCEWNEAVGDEIMFFAEKDWLKTYVKKHYNVDDLNYWLQNEYTSEESEEILIDGLKAGVIANIVK